MKLSNLVKLYKCLKENNDTYYLFDFFKNGIHFEVLFDIFPTPFKLHFLQRESNFSFYVEVKNGFIIDSSLEKDTYKKLCQVLKLTYDKNNPFSPKAFFEEFNENIPQYARRRREERELLPFYINTIEEKDKLFYDGIIEWNKINNGKNVSSKNLEKTRILYPEIYEFCKRENVSVRYTYIRRDDEENLLQKHKRNYL